MLAYPEQTSLVMPNFWFPARVAAEFSRLCDEGWDDGTSRVAPREMPELRFGLDDLWAACRRVPSRENNFCTIVIFSVEHQDWRYFVPFGHNFLWASVCCVKLQPCE